MIGLDNSIGVYNPNPLMPLYKSGKMIHVNLAPNTYYARGRLLGQVVTAANDVQTLTMAGTPTGGSIVLRVYHPASGGFVLVDVPYNATNTVLQGLITNAIGAGTFVVTGGAWPGTALVVTAAGPFAEMTVPLIAQEESKLTGGSPVLTVAHTTVGRTGGYFAPYADANSDGTQTAKAIIRRECSTDSGGNVLYSPETLEGLGTGINRPSVPVFISGIFHTSELVGFDAAALADLGYLREGSVANGVLVIPDA